LYLEPLPRPESYVELELLNFDIVGDNEKLEYNLNYLSRKPVVLKPFTRHLKNSPKEN
jgi:hypothetical protein